MRKIPEPGAKPVGLVLAAAAYATRLGFLLGLAVIQCAL